MKTAKEVLEAGLLPLYENYATFDLYADAALAALRDAGYEVIRAHGPLTVGHIYDKVIMAEFKDGVLTVWPAAAEGKGEA